MHAEDNVSPAASPEAAHPYVVGIGASSGGLAALQVLLGTLPAKPGFACVVVMHLSPEHESHLPELLQQHTSMPVREVTGTVALERDHVFVIPPNANIDTIDTHLRLTPLEERRSDRAPIDHFLRTLAATHDGTAIGVILTGGGSDGSIGLRHIKECGGLAIAQDPQEAEFDGMPRSAIASGVVDLVLPLRSIPAAILGFCATRPRLPDADDALESRDEGPFGQILSELLKRTGHDFRIYERATLLRRLRRRMRLRQVVTFGPYLELLARDPREAQALTNDLLMLPMEFFRDRATFQELEQRVIPAILASKTNEGGRLRAWTIGCSTGEEAYSLAMLLAEQATRQTPAPQIQVFATDLTEDSVESGRRGVFPREIAASVSAERLERFFSPQAGSFRVKREIRDTILFASHDLFKDPPFGHIDLIVCRALLSRLKREVRRGVLTLFHYALEPGGTLLIGPHDVIDTPELFEPEPGATLIFRKSGTLKRFPALPSYMQPFGPEGIRGTAHGPKEAARDEISMLHSSAIEPYTPPSVLIDAANTVVHFSSRAAKYVHIPGGELTRDLTRLVRDPIRLKLAEALRTVRAGGSRSWSSEPMAVPGEHGLRCIVLRVEQVAATGLVLVVFDDQGPASGNTASAAVANTIASLEAEVEQLRGQLRAVLGSLPEGSGPAQMHVQVAGAADDLRSVVEELAQSRQELQSVNEELQTLDEENRRRVQELTQISTDLQYLLAATGIATLFLDRQLNILRFTPQLGELFGLRLTDIGRPVYDLSRLARYWEFATDARRVLETDEPIEREVADAAGHWYLSRILPYHTRSDHVEGVVLTLIDITQRKLAELALQDSSRHKDEFLAVLAHELRNPLAPISSGIQVLKAAPGERQVVERISGTMERQTKQLVRLVDDLLEISRINGGKLRLNTSIVGLRDIVGDAISSVQPLVDRAGHTLRIDVPDEPVFVEGDSARLTQVLSNLLSNAVRYTERPDTIVVTVGRDGRDAVVTVKDNGVGIAPDALGHLFEMFYQGSNARTGATAGLGIGLSLAKALVEMHGGTLTAFSEGENRGSEFKVCLPLAMLSEASAPLAAAEDERNADTDHRILIVDDNVDAAETLCTLMKSLGEREVHTVSSGAQALQAVPELRPDIVLLDLGMPEMDGYEVARRMRNEPWGKNLMLVALSGWGQEEHRRRAKEAGFDQHMTKPADLAALRAVLKESRPSA